MFGGMGHEAPHGGRHEDVGDVTIAGGCIGALRSRAGFGFQVEVFSRIERAAL